MSSRKPFNIIDAKEILKGCPGDDVMLPMIKSGFGLFIGEKRAVLVFTTAEDQRIGIPMSYQGLAELYRMIGAALGDLKAPEGGAVQ